MPVQTSHHHEGVSLWGKTVLAALLVLTVSLVYGQVYHHGFLNYDDHLYVTDNATVKAGLTRTGVLWAFTTTSAANWHPLTWLSHMLDVQLFGVNPSGHHLTSVFLHILNTLLLLCLLYRTTGEYLKSFFVAALFALHPLHVESVAWIAERKDMLSAFFMLATILLYSLDREKPRAVLYLSALMAYAAGLMAKPMLVTLPFVLLLWDIWPLQRFRPWGRGDDEQRTVPVVRLVMEKLPFFVLSLLSCGVTYYAQFQAGAVASIHTMPFPFRLINALLSYVRYLGNMIWPENLAIIYPLPATLTIASGLLTGLALLALSVVVWHLRSRHPYLLSGWCWYLGTLVPVIGLVQVGQQAMADRYTYIPLMGIFIMIAWGVPACAERWNLRQNALVISAGAVLSLLAVCTWHQLGFWKDNVTLFEHAGRVVPGNFIAYRFLGSALAQQGDMAGAERAFQASLRISPDDDRSHTELGVVLAKERRYNEAVEHFSAALRTYPDSVDTHFQMGNVLIETGKPAEAIVHYKEALRLKPAEAEICYSLGLALAMQGDIAGGVRYLTKAVTLKSDFPEAHYNLGIALIRAGNMSDAVEHFSAAVRINPSFAEARKGLEAAQRLLVK
ncbi:tetratricopeptide repeat protein [Geomonas agri]|uniref:tetratricopeptide repeat protein n=1 Tax=Geomonas agri TaxID=2873702 RepID=UPI001CD43B5E|nr:tetratricopeptide repeat protein [Geomonas agri]